MLQSMGSQRVGHNGVTELTEDLFQPSLAVIKPVVPICKEWNDGHPEQDQGGTV